MSMFNIFVAFSRNVHFTVSASSLSANETGGRFCRNDFRTGIVSWDLSLFGESAVSHSQLTVLAAQLLGYATVVHHVADTFRRYDRYLHLPSR